MGPPELTVAVHDNGFTLTCQWFIQSLCRYHNFQRHRVLRRDSATRTCDTRLPSFGEDPGLSVVRN